MVPKFWKEIGYEPCTTFWQDFTIADAFGLSAIIDTYKRGREYAKTDYKALTELVMVLNHKIWQHYYLENERVSMLYDELWRELHDWSLDYLKDEELSYYLRTLD